MRIKIKPLAVDKNILKTCYDFTVFGANVYGLVFFGCFLGEREGGFVKRGNTQQLLINFLFVNISMLLQRLEFYRLEIPSKNILQDNLNYS